MYLGVVLEEVVDLKMQYSQRLQTKVNQINMSSFTFKITFLISLKRMLEMQFLFTSKPLIFKLIIMVLDSQNLYYFL